MAAFEGFAHVGVSTHDMDATISFYANVLDCHVVADERIELAGDGVVRQVSIDVGGGSYLVFMQATGVESIAEDYDTSINGVLGVPAGMYHYAFRLPSLAALETMRQTIDALGVTVSDVTDLGTAQAIFLSDPNGLELEIAVKVRDYTTADIGKVSKAELVESE